MNKPKSTWGGAGRGQGRKPRRRTYRSMDGHWLTVAEMKKLDAAMLRFQMIPMK